MRKANIIGLGDSGQLAALPQLSQYLSNFIKQEIPSISLAFRKLYKLHPEQSSSYLAPLYDALNHYKEDGIQARFSLLKALSEMGLNATLSQGQYLFKIAIRDSRIYNRDLALELLQQSTNETVLALATKALASRPKKLNLTGEQRKVLNLPDSGAVKITGNAGCGKTTVAIYRIKHLSEIEYLFHDTRIGVFTYTNSLRKHVKAMIDESRRGRTKPIKAKVEILTMHKWASLYYLKQLRLKSPHTSECRLVPYIQQEQKIALIKNILAAMVSSQGTAAIHEKTVEFYLDEISWIKKMFLDTREKYLNTTRVGRGLNNRITIKDKIVLWEILKKYSNELRVNELVDHDDVIIYAIRSIEKDESFTAPFSHVIVDEAQDLSKIHFMLLKKLVNKETKSITILADASQQIYKSAFNWSEIGLNLMGSRSFELKRNYRNTNEVAILAHSLISHDKGVLSEVALSGRKGQLPVFIQHHTKAAQLDRIQSILLELDLTHENVGILFRTKGALIQYENQLRDKVPYILKLPDADEFILSDSGCYLCTMPSSKGLEFDNVIIADLNEGLLPLHAGYADDEDEEHINAERRLLYTAMTRAKNSLWLISSGITSRYIEELDHTKMITLK